MPTAWRSGGRRRRLPPATTSSGHWSQARRSSALPPVNGPACAWRRTGRPLHWTEDGARIADRAAGVLGPAVVPARGAAAALYYPTQTWLVEGVVLDRPVRGFIFLEEAYLLPGGRLYVAKDPLPDVGYLTWYCWATQWEDGQLEIGHFLYGQRRFHVGLVADDTGRVRAAIAMDLEISASGRRLLARRHPDVHGRRGVGTRSGIPTGACSSAGSPIPSRKA